MIITEFLYGQIDLPCKWIIPFLVPAWVLQNYFHRKIIHKANFR